MSDPKLWIQVTDPSTKPPTAQLYLGDEEENPILMGAILVISTVGISMMPALSSEYGFKLDDQGYLDIHEVHRPWLLEPSPEKIIKPGDLGYHTPFEVTGYSLEEDGDWILVKASYLLPTDENNPTGEKELKRVTLFGLHKDKGHYGHSSYKSGKFSKLGFDVISQPKFSETHALPVFHL